MHRVLLLGAGKIGSAIAQYLSTTGDYDVLVADADEAALDRVKQIANVSVSQLSADDPVALREAMRGREAVVSALSFALNPVVAGAALEAGISYFDLTEDRDTTSAIRKIAHESKPG